MSEIEPVAWMRRDVTYREGDGRREGERVLSQGRVYESDIPLYPQSAIDALSAEVEKLKSRLGGVELQRGAYWNAYKSEQIKAKNLQFALDMLHGEGAQQRIEALREDAERYRWLREHMAPDELTTQVFPGVPPIINRPLDDSEDQSGRFDALIDAARSGEGE